MPRVPRKLAGNSRGRICAGRQNGTVDATPDEIETLAELRSWLDERTLSGLAVQGLDLTGIDLSDVKVDDALFLGCRLSAASICARPSAKSLQMTCVAPA